MYLDVFDIQIHVSLTVIMDKLDEKQRVAAVKLSTERLRIKKLAKSDLDEQVVADLTRD